MQKRCQICRSYFDCKDSEECWCWDKDIKPFLDRIPEGLDDCICRNCLTGLPERKPTVRIKRDVYTAGSNVAGIGP